MSSTRSTLPRASWMLEFLKGFRSAWLTAEEYAEVMGGNKSKAYDDLNECEANGLLVGRPRDVSLARSMGTFRGPTAPREFTLSKVWGGQG